VASAIKVTGFPGFMQVTRTRAFGAGALLETNAADDATNFIAAAAFVAFFPVFKSHFMPA
jgi:hypothetical protein